MKLRFKKLFFDGNLVASNIKLPGLHGLRAVAALMILFCHMAEFIRLSTALPLSESHKLFNTIGVTGVNLFFIVSAFSLANSTQLTKQGIREYAVKRFFRIAPLYYVMLVFQQLWGGPLGTETHSLTENILNLTFIFNLMPKLAAGIVYSGWTIGVEMLFYVILPLMLFTCQSLRSRIILVLLGMLISWASHRGMLESDPGAWIWPSYATFALITNIGAFCIGLLAFSLVQKYQHNQKISLIALLCSVILFIGFISSPLLANFDSPGRPALLVFFLIYGLLCLSQAISPSWLLRNPLMQYLGERSFSIYLVQVPIFFIMMKADVVVFHYLKSDSLWFYFLCMLITTPVVLLISTLTYHWIEIPGVNVGRHIIQKMRANLPTLS